MTAIRPLYDKLTRSPLVRGLVAFGSAEAATRIIRLGALLIVARRVTPEIFGTAALALSLFELVRVLANAGIGQRLIVARDDELASLCRTAYRLFWLVVPEAYFGSGRHNRRPYAACSRQCFEHAIRLLSWTSPSSIPFRPQPECHGPGRCGGSFPRKHRTHSKPATVELNHQQQSCGAELSSILPLIQTLAHP